TGSPRLYVGSQIWSFLLAASKESETLQVRQDPARILAPLGGSVELSCQINAAQHWERLRVEWRRDSAPRAFCQVVLDNASVSSCCRGMGACDDARLSFTWDPPEFTLRMGNISEDDVGWYVCKAIVEIPVYLDATGNGTMLNTSVQGWLEPCRQNSPAGPPLASERGTQMACVLIVGWSPMSSLQLARLVPSCPALSASPGGGRGSQARESVWAVPHAQPRPCPCWALALENAAGMAFATVKEVTSRVVMNFSLASLCCHGNI
uniref:Ig-like domain-containing protein n=1 Tax=Terrapene triunguis TaxID=2587831 RepID=A0A674KCE6_9SAUR